MAWGCCRETSHRRPMRRPHSARSDSPSSIRRFCCLDTPRPLPARSEENNHRSAPEEPVSTNLPPQRKPFGEINVKNTHFLPSIVIFFLEQQWLPSYYLPDYYIEYRMDPFPQNFQYIYLTLHKIRKNAQKYLIADKIDHKYLFAHFMILLTLYIQSVSHQ